MNELVGMICATVIIVTLIKAFAGAYSSPRYIEKDNDSLDILNEKR